MSAAGSAKFTGSAKVTESPVVAGSSEGSPVGLDDQDSPNEEGANEEGDYAGCLLDERYQLNSWMGGGGMGDVYHATDVRLRRSVAVKVFRSGADKAGRARFEEEAKLLARLSHPGLVPVHDASAYGDRPYLVMQLVEGQTLESLIEGGPLEPDRIAEIGRRLSGVLAYVHENGIVHRDVKPSNVLIAEDGRVFLADFGVSRLVDAVGQLTSSGMVMGTTNYMSPEQVRDSDIKFATDVYSLGLVLLECATGEQEYPGGGAESAVARLSRPPLVPEELPEPMAGILRAMTVDEPHWRPSAQRCAEALNGREVMAAAAVSTRDNTSTNSPTTEPVGGGPVGGGAVATGRVGSDFDAAQGDSSTSVSHRKGSGVLVGVLALTGVVVVAAVLVVAWLLIPDAPVHPAVPLPPESGLPGTERLPEDLANLERLVRQ